MKDNSENNDWLNDFPALKKQNTENTFTVPENFFEDQQKRIFSAIYADELKSKLPSTGFTVPDNYFENMQEQILSVIKLEQMRSDKPEDAVSADFFDEQQSIISARIKINEYAERGSGFTVPENYFNNLTDQINKKTGIKEVPQAAKVRNLFTKPAWKYAVAACLAIAVATGISIKQYQQQTPYNVQSQLSNLSDTDIEDYLKLHADSYDNHIILESSTSDNSMDLYDNQPNSNNEPIN